MANRTSDDGDVDQAEGGLDPADRAEPSMAESANESGVPTDGRTSNAGGTMSETTRSRDPDLDDEVGHSA